MKKNIKISLNELRKIVKKIIQESVEEFYINQKITNPQKKEVYKKVTGDESEEPMIEITVNVNYSYNPDSENDFDPEDLDFLNYKIISVKGKFNRTIPISVANKIIDFKRLENSIKFKVESFKHFNYNQKFKDAEDDIQDYY